MFSNPQKNILQFGINEGQKVADLGVGNGYYAFAIAERVGPEGHVFCVDISKDMLAKLTKEIIERNIANIETVWSDLEKENGTTLKSDSIDACVVANTLFQIENKSILAKEAYRILHTKGTLLLVEWADSFAGMGPHKDHIIKKSDAVNVFHGAGFILDREINAGEHHYGLVFRKA